MEMVQNRILALDRFRMSSQSEAHGKCYLAFLSLSSGSKLSQVGFALWDWDSSEPNRLVSRGTETGTDGEPELDVRFRELADAWKRDSVFSSSVQQIAMHPAYQKIVGMGPCAVGMILRDLQDQPDHWFWALHAITGENPVPEESQGKIDEMAKAWINWGREVGYLR